jgi:hypothetical protein
VSLSCCLFILGKYPSNLIRKPLQLEIKFGIFETKMSNSYYYLKNNDTHTQHFKFKALIDYSLHLILTTIEVKRNLKKNKEIILMEITVAFVATLLLIPRPRNPMQQKEREREKE